MRELAIGLVNCNTGRKKGQWETIIQLFCEAPEKLSNMVQTDQDNKTEILNVQKES